MLLTTQYLDEADRLATQIAVIDHGRVIATGTAAELKAKIGRQTLDVRPADPADLTRVAGGPVATPAWHSIAWSIAITVVFAPLAVRRYRRIG